ncbi:MULTISPECIES: D-alanyl-D-alanine carboxypeptidase family protein [unclassified Romboutsia]|uniref:D-alanyl-D-alanine carboxypeptidase family protein n=1 Tax=unclassified Romboutsia TaxID=2626894 RepID=UPI000F049620|nr:MULTISPECIES: D-alanyl-D-alanine carboxypeptidase family protein [unclassified Romboutsia]
MNVLIDKYKKDSYLQNEEYETIKLTKEDLYLGNLILVNQGNEFKQKGVKLLPIDNLYFEIYCDKPIYVSQEIIKPLLNLIDSINARKKLIAVSGYRSEEEQEEIYNNSILENGIEYTKKYVARPKESEHQTGLAIDLGEIVENVDFICPSFPDYGICKDFKDLAKEYGFIMRYKKDKENITNISEEKWHFRYVGTPHAKLINKYNYCLEEYIDFLKQFKYNTNHLKIEENNSKIEIFYIEMKGNAVEINLDKHKKYNISGNNVDGFIITSFEHMETNYEL